MEILSGWKEIANHLRKGVRTVQRYERVLGLPVRRPAGKDTGAVIATKAELDAWVAASPVRETFHLLRGASNNVAVLSEFRGHLKELRRLRQESAELRQELHKTVELLRENLRCNMSERDSASDGSLVRRAMAEVLAFDPAKKKVN